MCVCARESELGAGKKAKGLILFASKLTALSKSHTKNEKDLRHCRL